MFDGKVLVAGTGGNPRNRAQLGLPSWLSLLRPNGLLLVPG